MKRVAMLLGALVFLSQPAWGARTPVHEAAESQEYGRKFGGMIGRGFLNVATSFVDLIVNVVNETRTGPPFVGTLVGVAKGAGCTSLRVLSGGVDLVTFWVPGFNGFPVSDSYENCLAMTPVQPVMGMPGYPSEVPAYIPTGEPGAAQPVSPAPKEKTPRYTK